MKVLGDLLLLLVFPDCCPCTCIAEQTEIKGRGLKQDVIVTLSQRGSEVRKLGHMTGSVWGANISFHIAPERFAHFRFKHDSN